MYAYKNTFNVPEKVLCARAVDYAKRWTTHAIVVGIA